MSDLIDRQKVLGAIFELSEKVANEMLFIDAIVDKIENIPSVEPDCTKEEWIKTKEKNIYKCSYCGNILDFDGLNAGRGDVNYCPNCGKKLVW